MKNIKYSLCFIFFLTSHAFAQEESVIRKDIVYKEIDGHQLTAHIFYNVELINKQNNPAIAFFHGGGWVFGSPEEFFGACRRYAMMGFRTISFQYRLSINPDGTYPAPGISPIESVKDARSAIRWMRENAEMLKIDPDKIIVGGQSAGGQLALSTAFLDTINENTDNLRISPAPNALLLFSSSVNALEPWVDMLLGDRDRDWIWAISPYHNLKKGMVPTIGFMGEDDCMVLPYIVRQFRDKMVELGNPYELITYPGRGHYLGEGIEKYAGYFDEGILERTDEFLKKYGFMP